MRKLMHILFLSCLKATELIEKNLHFKLTMREKMQLKMHKMMCDACTNFEKQSIIIEKGISNIQKAETSEVDFEKLKERISDSIKGCSPGGAD
ncbi:hypothetical protein ACFLQ5_01105 [Bacteroidota bacterium]